MGGTLDSQAFDELVDSVRQNGALLYDETLGPSQRALIAASLVTLRHGQHPQGCGCPVCRTHPPAQNRTDVTVAKAAEMLGVCITTVQAAKTVLARGTAEEIAAVKRGETGVEGIARDIRAKRSAELRAQKRSQPLATNGKNPGRIANQKVRADIWAQLRGALTGIGGLPLPAEVAQIARGFDKAGVVELRLEKSIKWLEEFAHAWRSNRDKTAA